MKSIDIYNTLNNLIKNPVCELNFSNPFELLIATMLSAQTTDKKVNVVTKQLFEKYKNPIDYTKADFQDIFNIIKPLGLALKKTENIIEISRSLVTNFNSTVPSTKEELTTLKGVGIKTANVVLALAFNIPAFPVDTHVHRVCMRLGFININDSVTVCEEKLKSIYDKSLWIKMHHLLLLFGRYYCKSKKPHCNGCLLKEYCVYEYC